MSLLELPVEIVFNILYELEVPDILRLRQTCHHLQRVSQDRTVWLVQLHFIQVLVPLPRLDFLSLPATTLEFHVLEALKIANKWPLIRKKAPNKLEPTNSLGTDPPGRTLLGLRTLDYWLLVFYAEGLVYLWDLRNLNDGPRGKLSVDSARWNSFSVAMDRSSKRIIFALTKAFGRAPLGCDSHCNELTRHSRITTTRIFSFSLEREDEGHLAHVQSLHDFRMTESLVLRDLNLERRISVLSGSGNIHLVPWDIPSSQDGTFIIDTQPTDIDELWNGIIAARFVGVALVVVKSRTLEIYYDLPVNFPVSEDNYSSPKCLRGNVNHVAFRDVSLAKCFTTVSTDGVTVELELYGFDVLQGIFHYAVHAWIPPPGKFSIRTNLELHLVAVYPLTPEIRALGRPLGSLGNSNPSNASSQSRSHPRSALGAVHESTALATDLMGLALSGLPGSTVQAKAFVSAFALGESGRRAVWVERKRGSTVREVTVWNKPLPTCGQASCPGSDVAIINAKTVWRIQSYDLRGTSSQFYIRVNRLAYRTEDVTHCALDEPSGKIILGNRFGDVLVLDIE